jgi:hypothetical protein
VSLRLDDGPERPDDRVWPPPEDARPVVDDRVRRDDELVSVDPDADEAVSPTDAGEESEGSAAYGF